MLLVACPKLSVVPLLAGRYWNVLVLHVLLLLTLSVPAATVAVAAVALLAWCHWQSKDSARTIDPVHILLALPKLSRLPDATLGISVSGMLPNDILDTSGLIAVIELDLSSVFWLSQLIFFYRNH